MKTNTSFLIFYLYLVYNASLGALGLSLGGYKSYQSLKATVFSGLRGDVESTKSCMRNTYKGVVNEVKNHPLSSCVLGSSLCLSGLRWANLLGPDEETSKCPFDISKDLKNALTVKDKNLIGLLSMSFLYMLTKNLEEAKGTREGLKHFATNLLVLSFLKKFTGEGVDLSSFLQSLYVLTNLLPRDTEDAKSEVVIEMVFNYLFYSNKDFRSLATATLAGIISNALE